MLGIDGVSEFNALHSGKHDEEVQFCAFDILAEVGDDLRRLPRFTSDNLERLLARHRDAGAFFAFLGTGTPPGLPTLPYLIR